MMLFIPALSKANNAILDEAESLRITSPTQATALLSQVDVTELEPYQRNRYEYLSIFLDGYKGDFKRNLTRYKALLPKVSNFELAFKIKSAMMLSYQATNDWRAGVALAAEIVSDFETLDDKPRYVSYLFSTGAFYDFLDAHALALETYNQILRYKPNKTYQCLVEASQFEIYIDLKRWSEIDIEQQQQKISVCDQYGNPLINNLRRISLAEYWLFNGEPYIAMATLSSVRDVLFSIGYPQGELSYKALEIQVLAELGDDDAVEQLALSIINDPNIEQYVIAAETAHHSLASLYQRRAAFEQALFHQRQYLDYRLARADEALIVQRAIQQTNFELIAKQATIETLDTQNALLRSEAKLAAEQFENSVLAFGLLASIFTALMVWSYRGRRLQKRFEYLANTDSLTQIDNRMAFINKANERLLKAQKRTAPVALIMLDLDKFKHINDRYGHQAGDWALQQAAKVINEVLDPSMVFARMGGEEFAILKVGFGVEQATRLAEHCRAAIENIDSSDSGHQFSFTASFGVVDTLLAGYKLETLITAADLALFQSKNFGRNQVFQYSQKIHL